MPRPKKEGLSPAVGTVLACQQAGYPGVRKARLSKQVGGMTAESVFFAGSAATRHP